VNIYGSINKRAGPSSSAV